jgi:chromosome segregation ATPase
LRQEEAKRTFEQLDVFRMHNERLTKSVKALQEDLLKKRVVDVENVGFEELEREHQDQMDALLEQFTAQSNETQQLSSQCADLRRQLQHVSELEQDAKTRLDVALQERSNALLDLKSLEDKVREDANQTKMQKEALERQYETMQVDLDDAHQVWSTVWNGATFTETLNSVELKDLIQRMSALNVALRECNCPPIDDLIDALDLLSRVDQHSRPDALLKLQQRLEALAKEWLTVDEGIARATLNASKAPDGLLKMLAVWYFEARGKEAWQPWTSLIYTMFSQLELLGMNLGELNGKLAAKSMQDWLHALAGEQTSLLKLNSVEKQLQEAQETAGGLIEQVEKLQQELQLLQGIVVSLEKQLSEDKEETQRLEKFYRQQMDTSKLENSKKLIDMESNQSTENQSLKKALETTIATHRSSMDKLQQQLKLSRELEQGISKELDRTKQEVESQRAVMEQFTEEIAMRSDQIEELKSQLEQLNDGTNQVDNQTREEKLTERVQSPQDSSKEKLLEAELTSLQDQLNRALLQVEEKQTLLDELSQVRQADPNLQQIDSTHQQTDSKQDSMEMNVEAPYPTSAIQRFRAQLKASRTQTNEELLIQVENLTRHLQRIEASNK